MKKVLTSILIATLAMQLSTGSVLANTAGQSNGDAASAAVSEETKDEYPESWDEDDPMNEKAYQQIYGELPGTVSMKATPPTGITTTWSTNDGPDTFIHNDFNTLGNQPVVGIDVSYHNGSINWTKVKESGIEYVIIRAGYRGSDKGTLNTDQKFHSYIQSAKAAGLKVGVYFFTQALNETEAIEEAQYTLQLVQNYQLDLPIAYDIEDYAGGRFTKADLSKAKKTKNSLAFCQTIENAGYQAMVYSSTTWFVSELDSSSIAQNYGLWVARYNSYSYAPGETSRYGGKIDIWQCTSSAKVSGIGTNVDLNYFYNVQPTVNAVPTAYQAAKTSTSMRIAINQVPGAAGYQIFYSKCRKGEFKHLANVDASVGYYDWNVSERNEYYIKVRSYTVNVDGTVTYSKYSSIIPMQSGESIGLKVKTKKKLTMRKWAGTDYKKVATVPKGTPFRVLTTAKDTAGKAWYKVTYTKKGKSYTGYIAKSEVSYYVSKVSGVTQAGNIKNAVNVTWKKLPEADGYLIYRSTAMNGKYKAVKNVKSGQTTSYLNKKLAGGTEFYYKIRAYKVINGKMYYGDYSSVKVLHSKMPKKIVVKMKYSSNLRKYAGTSYKVKKTLPRGKKFRVLYKTKGKKGKTWYKVNYKVKGKTYTGYVSSLYAKRI